MKTPATRESALGELEALAGALLAVLLAFLHPAVAGKELAVAERRVEFLVDLLESAGDAEHDGAGLAGEPAAVDANENVQLAHHPRCEQRRDGVILVFDFGEVVVD